MTSSDDSTSFAPHVSATSLIEGSTPMDFDDAVDRLRAGGTFILSTVRGDGRPHAVPLFSVWADGAMHFAAADSTQKAHDIDGNPACVLNAKSGGSDLVVEGDARRVTEADAVERVAVAYHDAYGWNSEPDGAELHAPGAPTAGPPPYAVYRVDAHTVFAFPNDTDHAPTRWTIDQSGRAS